ncbi:MAG TPA: hypothetical protein PLL06_06610 [Acidobacteriota bacterium]|nr:hypothetical protein [Acidobacteriota bacterium]HMZ79352.1 hypothetical protein [Acidobacteriota bacterium]HNC43511.1 hypothetical protein [Acidobacteriota bacterium]HNG93824.1 hypothetical protein [Acidobacteriota bacterium]
MKPFKNHKIAEIANEKTRILRPSRFQEGVWHISEADLARGIQGLEVLLPASRYPSALQPGGQGGI